MSRKFLAGKLMARDHLEQGGYKKLIIKKCVRIWTGLMRCTD
jgi:hypothetical protein